MVGTGTLLNVATVLIGGSLGLWLGGRLPSAASNRRGWLRVIHLGLCLKMFLTTQNSLVVLGSILIGALLGEWWRVEEGLGRLGQWLEKRFARQESAAGSQRFVRGFLTASLVFCVGPMTILGSIQDGLTGDYQTLAIKSVLDGFASLAFASSLGVGVLFSALVILVYQGSLTLLAAQIQQIISAPMMTEMNATGGVILMAIAIGALLEIRPIRAGNLLPALFIAPPLVWIMSRLGLY